MDRLTHFSPGLGKRGEEREKERERERERENVITYWGGGERPTRLKVTGKVEREKGT